MKQIRLDKFLCDMSCGTRSEIKKMIRKGLVRVDGIIVKSPELKVTSEQEISIEGRVISYVEKEYILFHKPAGCVSATEDAIHQTVFDYVDTKRRDLFPVGRLDIDTEGFLLLTNDGELAHSLLSPKKKIAKTYQAVIIGNVVASDIEKFQDGLDIGDEEKTHPAVLRILETNLTADDIFDRDERLREKYAFFVEEDSSLDKKPFSVIEVDLTEGRYHEVKRMFEAVGKKVLYLKRIAMAGLQLDPLLLRGEYRSLTREELETLRNL